MRFRSTMRAIRYAAFVVTVTATVLLAGSRPRALGGCYGFNGDFCAGCQAGFYVDGTASLEYSGCVGGECVTTCQSWCQSISCFYYYDGCSDQEGYIDGTCGCSNCTW